jgi:hypothetical protein
VVRAGFLFARLNGAGSKPPSGNYSVCNACIGADVLIEDLGIFIPRASIQTLQPLTTNDEVFAMLQQQFEPQITAAVWLIWVNPTAWQPRPALGRPLNQCQCPFFQKESA